MWPPDPIYWTGALIIWLPAIPRERSSARGGDIGGVREARPSILGALLDAVAGALNALPSTKLDYAAANGRLRPLGHGR